MQHYVNDLNKKSFILAEQIKQLFATNIRTLVASTILAVILTYVESDVVAHAPLMIWLAVLIMVNLARSSLTMHCLRNPLSDVAALETRLKWFRTGVIVSSLIWGSICLFMFTPDLPNYQIFVIYILTGLSAGCVVSYSVDTISAASYILLGLTPMLIRFLWLGESVSMAMGVAGFIYIAYLIANIRNFNRNLIENIVLRHEAVEREHEIKQLAFYDPLTNLPNRRLLFDRLDHALSVCFRSGKRGALLFLDLDHFKLLNDTHGHDMGDLLLKKVAERLLRCVRGSDTVVRLGGDEFVVMLEDLSEDSAEATKQVEKVADLMIETLNIPYMLTSFEYISTPSIGIALFGDHGNSHEELLKHADIAMYQAKKAGRNAVRHFDFEMLKNLN